MLQIFALIHNPLHMRAHICKPMLACTWAPHVGREQDKLVGETSTIEACYIATDKMALAHTAQHYSTLVQTCIHGLTKGIRRLVQVLQHASIL